MFNLKTLFCLLAVTFGLFFIASANLEAGHCHRYHRHHCRSNVQVVVPGPTYVVSQPVYTPVCAPVYVAPQPAIVACPVYQPVYVAPRPSFGLSFSWLFR